MTKTTKTTKTKRLPRKMTLQQFVEKARETGLIFAVEFVRRSNGALDHMTCRTGVTKGTKGRSMGYDPKDHGLLSVYAMDRKGFRSIPVENIKKLTMMGQRFIADERSGYTLVEVEN
jgi:hypothetical protein